MSIGLDIQRKRFQGYFDGTKINGNMDNFAWKCHGLNDVPRKVYKRE
jgi:hypothetical protein